MSKIQKNIVVLSAICMASAILLGTFNLITNPRIAEYEAARLVESVDKVSRGMTVDMEVEDGDGNNVISCYRLYNGDVLSGYALQLRSVGYGGELLIAASYDTEGALLDSTLISDSETPGLGKKYESASNMAIFRNYSKIPNSKGGLTSADAEIVSGASTTFAAIGNALTAGQKFVISKGGAR